MKYVQGCHFGREKTIFPGRVGKTWEISIFPGKIRLKCAKLGNTGKYIGKKYEIPKLFSFVFHVSVHMIENIYFEFSCAIISIFNS